MYNKKYFSTFFYPFTIKVLLALLVFSQIHFQSSAQKPIPPKVVAAGTPQVMTLAALKDATGKIIKDENGNPFILGEGGISDFTNYTSEDGLALDGTFSVFTDKSGNLWFPTAGGGVSRFDGKNFTNFTTAHGLVNNTVRAGLEDKKGNIWLGTHGGLSRFDGAVFTNYKTEQGLVNNLIRSIKEDRKGNIWIGTENGLSCYNGKIFTNYTTLQGLSNNAVRCILEDRKGTIWFGTNTGVCRYDGKGITDYALPYGASDKAILSILEDKNGMLWFGTSDSGIIQFNGNDFKNYTTEQGLAQNEIRILFEDHSGQVWIGTNNGLSCFHSSPGKKESSRLFTSYTTLQGLPCNEISGILEDKEGNIWISTVSGGISLYNGKAFTNFTTINGLSNNLVRSVIEDENGAIWFGTDGSGACYYNGATFKNYSALQGLADNNVWCINKDKAGNIWFGTDGGVSRYDGKSFTNYTVLQGLPHNSIRSIMEDNKGNIWFGTYGGASCFDGKSFTNYTTSHGLRHNTVRSILQDKAGNIWFGTYGGGVSRFDGKSFVNYTTSEGLAKNIVFTILEDKNGILWMGTYGGGICRYDGKSFISFSKPEGLPDDAVTQITLAPFPVSAYSDLSSNTNQKQDYLVFGTNYGIAVLTGWKNKSGNLVSAAYSSEKEKNDLSGSSNEELKNYTPVFRVYNSSTGYPVKDVNSGQNGMYTDKNGIVWIATGSNKTALVRFEPDALNHQKEQLTLVIRGIKINEENISWRSMDGYHKSQTQNDSRSVASLVAEEVTTFGRSLTENERLTQAEKFGDIQFSGIANHYPVPQNLLLPFKHNNIIIDFAAIMPAKSFLLRYQYMLEGYNSEWSPLTSNTSATFGNIPEGRYTFRLKALNADGNWSQEIAYTFKVQPPFYRTWWAYLIYAVSFSTLLYVLYSMRTAALRKDKERLENTVQERTSEVVRQKNIVEEKNTLITDSIEYAKNIQHAILPSEEELTKSFPQHFVLYKPKDIVSGDFYWIYESAGKIIIAVADCTGHGVPGAFMSLMGSNFLNDIIKVKEQHLPSEILEELNVRVLTSLKQNNNNTSVKYGMDIALICIDKAMTTLQYAGAHSPLLIFRKPQTANGQPEPFQIKADKRSIGSIKKTGGQEFTNHTFQLAKGDMLYLFSDGFADQLGGPERKKFFSQTFKNLLQSICGQETQEQKRVLETTLLNWKGTLNQTDDILIVGIKI